MEKGTTLLFDWNNLAFRTMFTKDVGITTPEPDFQIWKYLTFNSLYQSLFKVKKVKEVVIAIDDTDPWRRVYFPRYKESRSKNRKKKDDINWKQLYDNVFSFSHDIKSNIPFKVILSSRAEADDVIGILARHIKNPCNVISNDEDFKQLLTEKRIRIYNPMKQSYVKCDDPEAFIITKCLTGQAKDDIFNIKTPNNWGETPETEGKRKPGFGPKSAEKVMLIGHKKWLKDNNLEERFKRNQILMDFNFIPQPIKINVIKQYESYEYPNADNIYKFMKNNHFRGFLEDFTNVENQLLKLY
jgi:hypothetical protein